MKRDILDKNGLVIGQLEMPDDTSEAAWQAKLNEYKLDLQIDAAQVVKFNIKARKEFADQMLEDFKAKNMSDGINVMQALWMHSRMRELSIVIGGVPMKLDILNMAVSGDIETACVALQYCTPDDMSMPYHWLNSIRVNWLVQKMKTYLGWA